MNRPSALVIDGNPVTLAATSAILHCGNFQTHQAQDGPQALAFGTSTPIDLVVSDLQLGTIDGPVLVEQLRQLPQCADVPALFLSSGQGPDVIRRAYGDWSAHQLRKPVDPHVLLELADVALWMPHLVKARINQPHFSFERLPARVVGRVESAPR